MQVCNEIFKRNGDSPAKALYYLDQTFHYVQKRLEGNDALADSTMMIVLSLVHQELLRNYQSAASVHFEGLEKMVQLRGGLEGLRHNSTLLLKIYK